MKNNMHERVPVILKTVTTLMLVLITLLAVACEKRPVVAEVGKPAPDFTLTDTKGKTWSLSQLKGQVVFVNFWATWCPPCREEMPAMQQLYKALPADKFKMLSILSNDKPAFAEAMAERIGFTFPILIDPNNRTAQAYGLTGVPETFIIDKKGVLREKYLGPMPWFSPGARQMLMKYINQ